MPPYCDEHQMYYRMAFVDGFPYQQCVCVKCESGRLSGFDSPQGTGTTEQPSVAAADKGLILTEEELTYIHDDIYGSLDKEERAKLDSLIASHRSLLSANAELSFKNMKLKEAYRVCGNGGNSLASVIIGWSLPKGWQDWTYVQANDYLHNHYGINSKMAYERYEIWLCWKSIREAGQTLEVTK